MITPVDGQDRPAVAGTRLTWHPTEETPLARAAVEVAKVNLWYGRTQALFDIDLTIPEHQVTAFIGPSGCGKSTLLRCLNRLNDLIDEVRIEGQILIGDKNIYEPGTNLIQ